MISLRVGTSGYGYKEWRGRFYPEKFPAGEMLRFYAERFTTVEVNNTFYRMPSPKVLEQWLGEVPDHFTFTLKSPRRITHIQRLVDCAENTAEFLRRADTLGAKLGPILFQLPPFLKKDLARLQGFLATLPPGKPIAFEFRHDSWHDADVHAALANHGAMLCVTDTDEGETTFVTTAREGYLRLRRTQYSDVELATWALRLHATSGIERAWVYFMHEDEALGTVFAEKLNECWRELTDANG